VKLNGTNQLLVYADGVNLLRDNVNTIKIKAEALTDTKGGWSRCNHREN
jgi:hypothetical protein